MNAIRNISAVLLLSSLALTALPAGASHSVFSAERRNTGGITTAIGPTHGDRFCYLSKGRRGKHR
jgi:hypothetical protein